jgi:hypothetical protein
VLFDQHCIVFRFIILLKTVLLFEVVGGLEDKTVFAIGWRPAPFYVSPQKQLTIVCQLY